MAKKKITGIGVLPVIHTSEKDVRSKNGILNIFSNKPRIIPNDWTEMNSRLGFPAFGESSSQKEGNHIRRYLTFISWGAGVRKQR